MITANVIVSFYRRADIVKGDERTTGTETRYMTVPARMGLVSFQRLDVRRAGELVNARWVVYLDTIAPENQPQPGNVLVVDSVCYPNDPLAMYVSRRFEVVDVHPTPMITTVYVNESLR